MIVTRGVTPPHPSLSPEGKGLRRVGALAAGRTLPRIIKFAAVQGGERAAYPKLGEGSPSPRFVF
jgi:hypothetical protein